MHGVADGLRSGEGQFAGRQIAVDIAQGHRWRAGEMQRAAGKVDMAIHCLANQFVPVAFGKSAHVTHGMSCRRQSFGQRWRRTRRGIGGAGLRMFGTACLCQGGARDLQANARAFGGLFRQAIDQGDLATGEGRSAAAGALAARSEA